MVNTFSHASQCPDFDFVEALQYSKDSGVVSVGSMVKKTTANQWHKRKFGLESFASSKPNVNSIGRYYKPWFYMHVESYLAPKAVEELSGNIEALKF